MEQSRLILEVGRPKPSHVRWRARLRSKIKETHRLITGVLGCHAQPEFLRRRLVRAYPPPIDGETSRQGADDLFAATAG